MIPRENKSEHTLRWKKKFAQTLIGHNNFKAMFPELDISEQELQEIDQLFQIQIPRDWLKRIPDRDINSDPVLRQYLPNTSELHPSKYFESDPVGDQKATVLPGLIKKYMARALIIVSDICPVHCRYCFRKNFPYPKTNSGKDRINRALDYCAQDTTINEVILSGGDPLSVEDRMIDYIFTRLESISHIDTVRIHTKFPSVIPERITPDFLAILSKSKLNKVCVFHINHPDEITNLFCEAAQKIKETNTLTLNQSVLLKDVNNNIEILVQLSQKLFSAGILPYYLHQLDPVSGTTHFHVPRHETTELMRQLKNRLPGYLVPKLAREVDGFPSKIY